MNHLVVFEDGGWRDLCPLTLTRGVFELRSGCDTLLDKAARWVPHARVSVMCRPTISAVVGERLTVWDGVAADDDVVTFLNGRLLPGAPLNLPCPSTSWEGDTLLAACVPGRLAVGLSQRLVTGLARHDGAGPELSWPAHAGRLVQYPWDLIGHNADELRRQIAGMPVSEPLRSDGVYMLNARDIRIGEGTRIKPATVLDAEGGPIHIGRRVTISPNVTVRGPCSIGDDVVVQAGANIREGTSIGPVCKVGGEIEGTIIQGYSNKQHDGFVGHSYIGEWVNLGADTVTSDLKNTYGSVSVPLHGEEIDSGQRFVGSIIGDHSKTGICTALNTGTVIGFSCNVVGSRPPRQIPTLSWLTEKGMQRYDIERAIAVARTVMGRRKVEMSTAMEGLFRAIDRSTMNAT